MRPPSVQETFERRRWLADRLAIAAIQGGTTMQPKEIVAFCWEVATLMAQEEASARVQLEADQAEAERICAEMDAKREAARKAGQVAPLLVECVNCHETAACPSPNDPPAGWEVTEHDGLVEHTCAACLEVTS